MYGLTKKNLQTLLKIFHAHKNEIAEVKIFGSRARGDYKTNSDIDIAVKFLRPIQGILAEDFEKSNFPYSVDIINLETAGENLLENINRDGKLLFQTKKGEIIMTIEQVKAKHEDFLRALSKLKIALEKNISDDELYLDGLIQRFEFCFELSWKLMQNFLAYEGISVNSPRSAIRKSFENEIILMLRAGLICWKAEIFQRTLTTKSRLQKFTKILLKNIFFCLKILMKV